MNTNKDDYEDRLNAARQEYIHRSNFLPYALESLMISESSYYRKYKILETERQSCCKKYETMFHAAQHLKGAPHIAKKYKVKPRDVYQARVVIKLLKEI